MKKIYTSLVLLFAGLFCSLKGTCADGVLELFNPQKPKLVVEIVVGAIRYDQLYLLAPNFSEGGFNKIVGEGISFTNARFSTINCNMVTGSGVIATGANPSGSGLVGESWVDLTTNKKIDAFEDKSYLGVGCNEDEGMFSPKRMTASTVADCLKGISPQSKVYSIALDKSEAIVHGGYLADGCYWYDYRRGEFATSSYYESDLKYWVKEFNSSKRKDGYSSTLWSVLYDIEKYHYQNPTAILKDDKKAFSFESLIRSREGNYDRLTQTPLGNSYIKDFAIEAIKKDSLGADDHCDLLVISLGAHRNVAQIYGAESTETEDSYYRVDKDIADILEALETTVGKDNFVVMLTSNHGVSSNVAQNERRNSGKFNAMQFTAIISGYMNMNYGSNNWVTAYENNQIYLNRPLIYEKEIDLATIQNRVAAIAMQFDGVANALTATALQTGSFNRGVAQKMQNNHFARNGGDVMINLLPGWIEIDDKEHSAIVSSWGSPYEYDVHVPLMFYGKGIEKLTVTNHVDMTDVAPTISGILGAPIPNATEGATLSRIGER